jgi:uncharacterized membrane-anchored protein
MSIKKTFLLAGLCLGLLATTHAADKKLNVLNGPAKAQMKGIAQIEVPAGFDFIDGEGTRAMMKAYGEPVSGRELGLIMPTNSEWSVIFEFNDVGYVKDDDKNKLDADKLLASFKEGTEEANKERVSAGHPALEIIGWEQPPHYDESTHNLEWAIRATSGGREILNYNTRLLGRKGVMEVVLVVNPQDLSATLPQFKNLLASYSFQTSQSYAEYRPGDKVAKYGLAALVLGGAAVGAAKLGLLTGLLVILKKAWKLVIIGVAAVASFFKKIFRKLTGRRSDETSSSS